MNQSIDSEQNDRWVSYPMETPDGLVVTHVNLDVRQDPALDTRLLIAVPIKNPSEHGLPGREEDKELWELEDKLESHLMSNFGARLVGRTTHGGKRMFCYYVAASRCKSAADAATSLTADYEPDFSATTDPDWEFYTGFLCPSEDEWALINSDS